MVNNNITTVHVNCKLKDACNYLSQYTPVFLVRLVEDLFPQRSAQPREMRIKTAECASGIRFCCAPASFHQCM